MLVLLCDGCHVDEKLEVLDRAHGILLQQVLQAEIPFPATFFISDTNVFQQSGFNVSAQHKLL